MPKAQVIPSLAERVKSGAIAEKHFEVKLRATPWNIFENSKDELFNYLNPLEKTHDPDVNASITKIKEIIAQMIQTGNSLDFPMQKKTLIEKLNTQCNNELRTLNAKVTNQASAQGLQQFTAKLSDEMSKIQIKAQNDIDKLALLDGKQSVIDYDYDHPNYKHLGRDSKGKTWDKLQWIPKAAKWLFERGGRIKENENAKGEVFYEFTEHRGVPSIIMGLFHGKNMDERADEVASHLRLTHKTATLSNFKYGKYTLEQLKDWKPTEGESFIIALAAGWCAGILEKKIDNHYKRLIEAGFDSNQIKVNVPGWDGPSKQLIDEGMAMRELKNQKIEEHAKDSPSAKFLKDFENIQSEIAVGTNEIVRELAEIPIKINSLDDKFLQELKDNRNYLPSICDEYLEIYGQQMKSLEELKLKSPNSQLKQVIMAEQNALVNNLKLVKSMVAKLTAKDNWDKLPVFKMQPNENPGEALVASNQDEKKLVEEVFVDNSIVSKIDEALNQGIKPAPETPDPTITLT